MVLTLQRLGQELLVRLLIASNHLQVAVGGLVQTGLDELLLGVVLHALLVEAGLEVLESQGILEDVG